MPYCPILGTLAYVFDRPSDRVLLVHRIGRPDDEQLGKWNGLGGKLESNEGVADGMRRELREEAGIEVTSMSLRGTVNWPGFGPHGEDWMGFIFLVDTWTGDPPPANAEGPLEWVPRLRILQACHDDQSIRRASGLDFWDGDRHFLPLLFDHDPRPFHGAMPYAHGLPVSWSFERW